MIPNEIKIGAGVVVAIFGIFVLFALKPFTVVGPGERGVVMKWGKVQPYVLGEGLHFFTPIETTIKIMSVQVLKDDVKAEAASKDLQDVKVDVVVNWHFDPTVINRTYQAVGDQGMVSYNVLSPAVSEVVKAATAQKTAEEIIKERQDLKANIDKTLVERLSKYGIIINDISLVNVDFSADFNAAIEAKQVAEQQAQQAVFTAQKATQDAQAAINKAKGEAEAQRLQQQTLTPELLQKMALERWNGVLPVYMSPGSAVPFLNIK